MSQSKDDRRRAKIERMKIEPGSSYFKVMVSLTLTEGFRKLYEVVETRLTKGHVIGHRFSFNRNYQTNRYDSYPHCLIDYGREKPYETGWAAGTTTFEIPKQDIITNSEILAIVTAHFGTKECPTYNCARDVIEEKFPDFARSRILDSMQALVGTHQLLIAEQWMERRSASFFRKDRDEARATACIAEIRGRVEQFYKKRTNGMNSDGAADCLRRAAEEIQANDVLVE